MASAAREPATVFLREARIVQLLCRAEPERPRQFDASWLRDDETPGGANRSGDRTRRESGAGGHLAADGGWVNSSPPRPPLSWTSFLMTITTSPTTAVRAASVVTALNALAASGFSIAGLIQLDAGKTLGPLAIAALRLAALPMLKRSMADEPSR